MIRLARKPGNVFGLILWVGLIPMLLLAGCSSRPTNAESSTKGIKSGEVLVEVIALNHPPVRPILNDVDQLLSGYGDRVLVQHYDFDTQEGQDFAKQHGLETHTPLAIFINGQMEYDLGVRKVKFYSFPQGEGTGVVPDGSWSLDDLRQVLDQTVAKP